MRVHVPSLPHTNTTKAYDWCAYTAKVRRFCTMLTDEGHEVILYAGPENEARVAEHLVCAEPQSFDNDWTREVFDRWDPRDDCWRDFNSRVLAEMLPRLGERDVIGIIAGHAQAVLRAACPQHLAVEWGIGYEGILAGTHHVFESHAWQAFVHGRAVGHGDTDWSNGRLFDTVIPNAFDPEDFAFAPVKDDFLLYLGRATPRKGLSIVEEVQRATGLELVVAGQDGYEWQVPVTKAGVVLGARKAALLASARAVLVPTQYIEPFGGVAVEAMLSGTPAITTDFGAFPETVKHGVSGFRCSTLADFIEAVDQAPTLDPATIRSQSREFTTPEVAPRYSAYLERLALLHGEGWYTRPALESS